MLDITCPSCEKAYRIAPEHNGKQVRCQQCGMTFVASPIDHHSPAVLLADEVPSKSPASGYAPTQYSRGSGQNSGTRVADEIDYEIRGDDMQFVEITLDPGETVIAEAGAMMFMTGGIEMQTVFGDPSKKGGGFWDKVMSAGKRVLTGESLFMTTFTNSRSQQREVVAFGAPYAGKILPMHLDELGGEIICQKDAFLCGAKGIEVSIAFQKKIATALFGGEGFIMQRLKGDGIAMVHASGAMMHRVLGPGEQLRLDTGCLMAIGPRFPTTSSLWEVSRIRCSEVKDSFWQPLRARDRSGCRAFPSRVWLAESWLRAPKGSVRKKRVRCSMVSADWAVCSWGTRIDHRKLLLCP